MALKTIQLASFDEGRVSFRARFDDVTGEMDRLIVANTSARAAFMRVVSGARSFERTLAAGVSTTITVPSGSRPLLRETDGARFEFRWPA